jgi:threonine synthase
LSNWKSTRTGQTATLVDALFQGPAPDGSLYVPAMMPRLDATEVVRQSRSFADVALGTAIALFGDEVPASMLEQIVAEALDFPVPLVSLGDDIHVLELFHGPTAAFKDVGARFMAALMDRLDPEPERSRLVLVATSGDTGGAVAHAFAGMPRFRVVVLFPREGVSDEQRRLFTTLGGNVTAVSVSGSFDDCQDLVKAAFRSSGAKRLGLTAATSINVGRLVPQTFYYLEAMRQGGWSDCVFAVPSGNLGNLTAGLLAALAGLPVRRFIAALNANDTFLRHLETGTPGTRPVRRTFSSAMDVSLPNNLERLISLTGGDRQRLRRWVWSASFSDDTTLECMARVRAERGYLLDPHGAVGMLGAEAYRREEGNEGPMVVLATAHPAKLTQVVEKAVGERPSAPPEIVAALAREEKIVPLYPSEERFFELLEEVGTARVMAR